METFKRVTGLKAIFVRQSVDEWMGNFLNTDRSVAVDVKGGTSWKVNFSSVLSLSPSPTHYFNSHAYTVSEHSGECGAMTLLNAT